MTKSECRMTNFGRRTSVFQWRISVPSRSRLASHFPRLQWACLAMNFVIHSTFALRHSIHHSFVIVSSRFKILLATIVQAASSLGFSFSFTGDSPTRTNSGRPACYPDRGPSVSVPGREQLNFLRRGSFAPWLAERQIGPALRDCRPASTRVRCARARAAST